MTIAAAVAAGTLGAVLGSVLSVVAWRVPRAIPLRISRRIGGDQVTSLWADLPILRRHRQNGVLPKSVALSPPAFELTTGLVFVLLTWRFGVTWLLPAYLTFAAAAVLLGVIDLQHQRLPNVIVAPFALVTVSLLILATIGSGAWESLARAIFGAAILFGVFLALALISPASLGMGDVKLAGVLGLLLAYLGWRILIYGATGAFVISALIGAAVLLTHRGNRRTQIPFGPSMLLAALIAVLVSGA